MTNDPDKNIDNRIDYRINPVDAPYGGELVNRRIADPYKTGRFVVATGNLRDDPLAKMMLKDQIKVWQFEAGRHLQAAFDVSAAGSVQSIDLSKPYISGGGGNIEPSERKLRAIDDINQARKALGQLSYELVTCVLDAGMTIEQASSALSLSVDDCWRRLGVALDKLAELFGLVTKNAHARKVQRESRNEGYRRARVGKE